MQYQLKNPLPPLPEGYPISANIVLDSISPRGKRITTLELEFPRYILAELGTHRVLSRNSSSSRAIPLRKAIDSITEKPVFPVRWGKNQKGMQPSLENLEGEDLTRAQVAWYKAQVACVEAAQVFEEVGLHKQWAARCLEWFGTIRLVVTATQWDGIFMLRDHPAAQDEISYLIQAIKTAMNGSTPVQMTQLGWHLPYVTEDDFDILGLENALKVSAARCARVSYKTVHGVTSTLEEDVTMFKRLAPDDMGEDNPFHASPTEHQARPSKPEEDTPHCTGNFVGWVQHRKVIEGYTTLYN